MLGEDTARTEEGNKGPSSTGEDSDTTSNERLKAELVQPMIEMAAERVTCGTQRDEQHDIIDEDVGCAVKDDRRSRSHRFHNMCGATARRNWRFASSHRQELRCTTVFQSVQSASGDGLLQPGFDSGTARFLSAAEIEHGLPTCSHLSYSLDKDRRWECLTHLMHDPRASTHLVPERQRQYRVDGSTRAQVLEVCAPLEAMLLHRGTNTTSWKERVAAASRSAIYEMPANRLDIDEWRRILEPSARNRRKGPLSALRRLCTVPFPPPDGLPAGACRLDGVIRGALADVIMPASGLRVWYPEGAGGALTLDLGREQGVTHVSVRGLFPKVESMQLSHLGHGYPGVCIRVAEPARDRQWVTRFALFARGEGRCCVSSSAGSWTSLGEFGGNSDGITEVTHAVLGGAPLVCRHLRFVPLAFEGRPAMSIAAFGCAPDSACDSRRDSGSARGKAKAGQGTQGAGDRTRNSELGGSDEPSPSAAHMQYLVRVGLLSQKQLLCGTAEGAGAALPEAESTKQCDDEQPSCRGTTRFTRRAHSHHAIPKWNPEMDKRRQRRRVRLAWRVGGSLLREAVWDEIVARYAIASDGDDERCRLADAHDLDDAARHEDGGLAMRRCGGRGAASITVERSAASVTATCSSCAEVGREGDNATRKLSGRSTPVSDVSWDDCGIPAADTVAATALWLAQAMPCALSREPSASACSTEASFDSFEFVSDEDADTVYPTSVSRID